MLRSFRLSPSGRQLLYVAPDPATLGVIGKEQNDTFVLPIDLTIGARPVAARKLAERGRISWSPDGKQLLFVKAALDGLVAIVFASTLGWGVAFSALTIVVVQGSLTLAAGAADRVLTARMIDEMTATGGVMIIGIGLRLLDLKRVRVASFLPALVLAPVAVALFAR